MGNLFGKSTQVWQSSWGHGDGEEEEEDKRRLMVSNSSSTGYIRIKVVMSKRQLEDFMAQAAADTNKGGFGELGRTILREYMQGRLHGRIVAATGQDLVSENWRNLSAIKED